ncbi:MAG: glycogen/starch synthase [Paludibacteraceae bacterium]|nr:glycogen/starch synthase [Paludibacteraceae bacterium]
MRKNPKILFISQEIYPYLTESNSRTKLSRMLPQYAQASGFETRTFMPKFSEINERRNQLHEVIRLSGMNIIIDDTDHQLIIKVASIPEARIQVYFIDNEEFFHRHSSGKNDNDGKLKDNAERSIFYVRGSLETIEKLRWTPDIIVCQGWLASVAPLYIKTAYHDNPFFRDAVVITRLDDNIHFEPYADNFGDIVLLDGITREDVKQVAGKKVDYASLTKLALQYSDAVIFDTPFIEQEVKDYALASGKPILDGTASEDVKTHYLDFFRSLLGD